MRKYLKTIIQFIEEVTCIIDKWVNSWYTSSLFHICLTPWYKILEFPLELFPCDAQKYGGLFSEIFLVLLPHTTSVWTFSFLHLYRFHAAHLWLYSQKFLLSGIPDPKGLLSGLFGEFMGRGSSSSFSPSSFRALGIGESKTSASVSCSPQSGPRCFPVNTCWLL